MKPTAGYAKPRRVTEPPTQRARLNLQRRPKPDPSEETGDRQSQALWKWVVWIALVHVLVILGASLYYLFAPAPKPPDQFITLLPPGDVVHGSPGPQQARKIGATQQAAPHRAAAPPPPSAHVTPPQPPKPVTTPPVVKPPPPTPIPNAIAPVKPPKPVKPVKPKTETPKVKVDLHEVDRTDATDTPPKPAKHHAKKPVQTPDDAQDDNDASRDTTGLSKEQIAEKLGDKLEPAGTHNAQKYGASGSRDGHTNNFQDFYDMIAQQMNDSWQIPQTAAEAQQYPVVHIYVGKDGIVPPDRVWLVRSSGIPAYDESALAAAKKLGYLHEPLPSGCAPDITINCKPEL